MEVVDIQVCDYQLALLLNGELVPLVDSRRVKHHDFYLLLTTRKKLVISAFHLLEHTYIIKTG